MLPIHRKSGNVLSDAGGMKPQAKTKEHTMNAKTVRIQIEKCDASIAPEFIMACNYLLINNPRLRMEAAHVIQSHGLGYYIGGNHVAILDGKERLAVITSDRIDGDWN